MLVILATIACREEWPKTVVWSDDSALPDTLYRNPLFEPDLADPTFLRTSDGWFYAYGTENTWTEGKHHITPIVRSKDMITWEYAGDAFAEKPNWKATGGIWAPQIIFNKSGDGLYYLYYSFSTWGDDNPGIGVATSSVPQGPFKDLGKILDTESSGVANSIDPFYIETGSGRNMKNYLFWGSFRGIYGVEMGDMKTAKLGTKFKIAGDAFEAVYIYEYNNRFYFFGSSGSCCEGADSRYHITVAVSDNIKGPYLTKNGVDIISDGTEGTLFLSGDKDTGFVGPGHNSEIIKDDNGRYFILYHAVKYNDALLPNGSTRRPLMMDEIIWIDGWPTIQGGVPSNLIKSAPYFEKN